MTYVVYLLAAVIATVLVFTPHEFAHAYIAYKNGDPTAKFSGRMTLNPLKHFDPVGFVMIVLVGFGWAKPVPVNEDNFRHRRLGLFTTAIAGIVTNYIIAFLVYSLYLVVVYYMPQDIYWLYYFCEMTCYLTFTYSLCAVIFNILPFYPLDGFRVLESFTRAINPVTRFLRNYGQIILTVLIVESFACNILGRFWAYADYLNVLGYIMKFAQQIIGWPITKFWGLIIH